MFSHLKNIFEMRKHIPVACSPVTQSDLSFTISSNTEQNKVRHFWAYNCVTPKIHWKFRAYSSLKRKTKQNKRKTQDFVFLEARNSSFYFTIYTSLVSCLENWLAEHKGRGISCTSKDIIHPEKNIFLSKQWKPYESRAWLFYESNWYQCNCATVLHCFRCCVFTSLFWPSFSPCETNIRIISLMDDIMHRLKITATDIL